MLTTTCCLVVMSVEQFRVGIRFNVWLVGGYSDILVQVSDVNERNPFCPTSRCARLRCIVQCYVARSSIYFPGPSSPAVASVSTFRRADRLLAMRTRTRLGLPTVPGIFHRGGTSRVWHLCPASPPVVVS